MKFSEILYFMKFILMKYSLSPKESPVDDEYSIRQNPCNYIQMKRILLLILFFNGLSDHTFGQCHLFGPNLLLNYNCDFSAAYSGVPPGFQSSATYSGSPVGAGYYYIVTFRNWGACNSSPEFDHTHGNSIGKFLWYDTPYSASSTNPAIAWTPYDPNRGSNLNNSIHVQKNVTYIFSVWVRDLARNTDCINGGAPLVGLRINGHDLGEADLTTSIHCCPEWTYLCGSWNSGNEDEADLKIESRRGNGWTDLGIDDVYFGEAGMVEEGVTGISQNTAINDKFSISYLNKSLFIEMKDALNEETEFVLFNCLGEELQKVKLHQNTAIDLLTCQDGIYFYNVRSGQKIIKQGKFIKINDAF